MNKIEHNVETGEIIEVEMTKLEIDELKKDNAMIEKRAADDLAKAAARQAVLDRLGLTEEEAQFILGGSN